MKYVWRLCSLTCVAKQGSIVFMTIKAETGLSKDVCGEWERETEWTSQEYKQKYYVTTDTRVFIN